MTRSQLPEWARKALRRNEAWTFAILVVLVAYFSISAPGKFFTVYDITQIAVNAAIYLVLGVGMTYVIITAGIDLSIGSVLVLAAVAAGEYTIHHGGAGEYRLDGRARRRRCTGAPAGRGARERRLRRGRAK